LVSKSRGIDRTIDAMVAIALVGVAWLTVMGHRGLAPCAGFMALGVAMRKDTWRAAFYSMAPGRFAANPASIAFLCASAFCFWVAVTSLWSPTQGGIVLALTVFAAVATATALVYEALTAAAPRLRFFAFMVAGAISIASCALLFEGLSGAYLRDVIPPQDASPLRWKDFVALGRGVTAMAPLIFPVAVIIWRVTGSREAAAAPVLVLFVAATRFSIFTNVAAIALGAACFSLAFFRPKATLLLIVLIFLAALLGAPLIGAFVDLEGIAASGGLPMSWAQRAIIWAETSRLALGVCAPFGCGADFSRALAADARLIEVPGAPGGLPAMPIHPHNAFLQIWLELGLPGVVAAASALIAAAISLYKLSMSRPAFAAICGALAASLISLLVEASLWQAWRLAVFGLAAFACTVAYRLDNSRGV